MTRPAPRASDPERGSVTSTSRSLVVRLKNGDEEAWDRLVDLYAPLVHHWCRRLEVAADDVPDVVQEVFQTVARSVDRFRRDRPGDTFRGWLRVITRSRAIDHFRRHRDETTGAGGTVAQQMLAETPDTTPDLDEDVTAVDEEGPTQVLYRRALEVLRSEFREPTWRAFWRVVVDGCTPTEVAEELGSTPGAVRVAKCRVLQRLRRELGDTDE